MTMRVRWIGAGLLMTCGLAVASMAAQPPDQANYDEAKVPQYTPVSYTHLTLPTILRV